MIMLVLESINSLSERRVPTEPLGVALEWGGAAISPNPFMFKYLMVKPYLVHSKPSQMIVKH